MMYPVVKLISIEITNALNTLQNLYLFLKVRNRMLELLQRFESLLVRDQARKHFSNWTHFNRKYNASLTVKISRYFLSHIAFKTYQRQYKRKYSVGLLNALKKLKILNLPLFRTFTISKFLAGPVGV